MAQASKNAGVYLLKNLKTGESYIGASCQLVQREKKDMVRRLLRNRKGTDDWPIFANLQMPDASGKARRVYMRERYMKVTHYRQVSGYWKNYAFKGIGMANGWAQRCNDRYTGDQIPIPFPETK